MFYHLRKHVANTSLQNQHSFTRPPVCIYDTQFQNLNT